VVEVLFGSRQQRRRAERVQGLNRDQDKVSTGALLAGTAGPGRPKTFWKS
jgi:hypothetical protein